MPIANNSLIGSYILDINECASNPCKNGATCNDYINMYNCTCPPGYYGYNCQKGKYCKHIPPIYIFEHNYSLTLLKLYSVSS